MSHDNELEQMRERLDPAEERELKTHERYSQGWFDCLEKAFKGLAEDHATEIADGILIGRIPKSIKTELQRLLDEALLEAAQ